MFYYIPVAHQGECDVYRVWLVTVRVAVISIGGVLGPQGVCDVYREIRGPSGDCGVYLKNLRNTGRLWYLKGEY